MANEALIRSSLEIKVGELEYRSLPTSFQADVSATGGPTPGTITATLTGIDVDLSELAVPGLCRIHNLDATNKVEIGAWDGTSFQPLMDLLAGEWWVGRLAASLGDEFGTGTGTITADVNTLRIKADTAPCIVLVEAFHC